MKEKGSSLLCHKRNDAGRSAPRSVWTTPALVDPRRTRCTRWFCSTRSAKIREDAVVRNEATYLALGVLPDGPERLP